MKSTINFLNFSCFTLLIILLAVACKKDALNDLPPDSKQNANLPGMQKMNTTLDDPESGLCFDFVYPVTVILPDDSEVTGNSLDELEIAIHDWYEQNPGNDEDPTLAYPVDVILEDGTSKTLESDDDLYELLDACDWDDDDDEWKECFEVQYPVTIVYPDGTTATANNDDELGQLFEDWEVANPNSYEYPTFEFPITVEYDDELLQIQDEEELEFLFEACFADEWNEVDFEFIDCFDFVYPIEVEMPDGTVLTANDYEELDEIFISYFEDPDPNGFPTFVYPFSLILDDETILITNEDEFEEVLDVCYEESVFEDCFTFNYPITVIFPDGTSATVNNDEELESAVDAWYTQNPSGNEDPTLEYPVEITLEDGTVVTVNSDDEMEEILEECFDCLVVNGGDLAIGNRETAAAALLTERHADVKANRQEKIARTLAR